MKTPRDLSGAELAKALQKLGYTVTRQTGSYPRNVAAHHRMTTSHLLELLEL